MEAIIPDLDTTTGISGDIEVSGKVSGATGEIVVNASRQFLPPLFQIERLSCEQFLFNRRRQYFWPVALQHNIANTSLSLITIVEQAEGSIIRKMETAGIMRFVINGDRNSIALDLDSCGVPCIAPKTQRATAV